IHRLLLVGYKSYYPFDQHGGLSRTRRRGNKYVAVFILYSSELFVRPTHSLSPIPSCPLKSLFKGQIFSKRVKHRLIGIIAEILYKSYGVPSKGVFGENIFHHSGSEKLRE